MSGQTQRLNVVPTVTMLGVVKARLVGATRGHALLKKKSDALTVQFRQILKKIVSTKESMGDIMKTSSFALTEAKYVAGDNIKHVVLENVREASLKVRSRQENVAGVKLPKFEYTNDGEVNKNDLTGLARGYLSIYLSKKIIVSVLQILRKNIKMFMSMFSHFEVSQGQKWSFFLGMGPTTDKTSKPNKEGPPCSTATEESKTKTVRKDPSGNPTRWRPMIAPEFDGINCFESIVPC